MDPIIKRYAGLPNLRFLGFVDGKDKYQLLGRCWALVNTSIHEAMPVSYLEAFAMKTPVVGCINSDGLVERFGNYTGPVLGDGLDEDSLRVFEQALDGLLSDRQGWREKGEAAHRYVKIVHSFASFQSHLQAIYQQALR